MHICFDQIFWNLLLELIENAKTYPRLQDIFDFCGLMSHQNFDVTPWIDRCIIRSPWYSMDPKLYGHDYNLKSSNRYVQTIKHRFLTKNDFSIKKSKSRNRCFVKKWSKLHFPDVSIPPFDASRWVEKFGTIEKSQKF